MKSETKTTPERAAELDAKYAVQYRNRKPHFRYIVVYRPNGSITWSQSTTQLEGCIAPTAILYITYTKANVRANEIRKMDVRIARPVPHLVKYEARVIKVLLPR
jgi:hypothetical protein